MQCPACGRTLAEMTVADVTVDVCRGGCGGIWFDRLEVRKLDDRDEAAGEALLQIERDPAVTVDHAARRRCPRCPDVVLMRRFYSPKRQVEVDECAACGGFWLDAGELGAIRSEYPSAGAREKSAREFVAELRRKHLGEGEDEEKGPGALGTVERVFGFLLGDMA